MKKIVIALLGVCLLMTNMPFSLAEDKVIVSETVKIIAYNQTANEHVIEKSLASGTLISADGLILTNHHVVTDGNDENYETFAICTVSDENQEPDCLYTASLVAKDKALDAAVLKIDAKDVYGNNIPVFPYLNYTNPVLPNVNENITVFGFPGIGGETLTVTKGQVSGYEDRGNIKNLKTDATISSGNSGGTAKNSDGEFVGVPTYLRADLSTLGYIVPLTEIEPWLKGRIGNEPNVNRLAQDLLQELLEQKNNAENENKYRSTIFPFYEIAFSDDWEIQFLNDSNLMLQSEVEGFSVDFNIKTEVLPYEIKEDFMLYLFKKLEKYKTFYTNYERAEMNFAGRSGYVITYDLGSYRNVYGIVPLENTLLTYSYQLSVNDLEVTEGAIEELVSGFEFLDNQNNTEIKMQRHQQSEPEIKIATEGDFYIAPALDSQEEELIVNIYNPKAYEQTFQISEEYLEEDWLRLDQKEILEEEIRLVRWEAEEFRLLNKSDDVVIDGLRGVAYSYLYKGEDFNEVRKSSVVLLLNGKKTFRFNYDDLSEMYDQNLESFRYVLNHFQYDGDDISISRGEYNVPTFTMFFGDLENYIYEKEINALYDKEILGIDGTYFYPEDNVSRLDAFEAIVNSKIYLEGERNLTDLEDAIAAASEDAVYEDQDKVEYNQMFNYALKKKILSESENFYPQRGITVAETLKILCEMYELPVWNPPYRERLVWYVPYMYKGRQLGIIPYGASIDTVLTRGEFSAMLYEFLTVVGERGEL